MGSNKDDDVWCLSTSRDPFLDESLAGYIVARFADEGDVFETTRMIDRLAGSRRSGLTDIQKGDCNLATLARCLHVDESKLRERSYDAVVDYRRRSFFGVEIDKAHFDNDQRRFAPQSLAKEPYHRALWQNRHLPLCVETGEYLINRCPASWCGARQSWHRTQGVENCDRCATPLSRAVSAAVSAEQLPNLRALASLLLPNDANRQRSLSKLPTMLSDLTFGEAFDMAVIVARFVQPQVRVRTRAIAMHTAVPPETVCAAMSSAWDLMLGWPESFEAIAHERLAKRRSNGGDGNKGATLELFRNANLGNFPTSICEVFQHIERRWLESDKEGYNLDEAMNLTGHNSASLMAWRRELVLPIKFWISSGPIIGRGGAVRALFCKRAIDDLYDTRRSGYLVQDAANTLDVPSYAVEQLICLNVLREIAKPDVISGNPSVIVDRRSIDELHAMLVSKSEQTCMQEEIPLYLALAAQPGLKPWGPAIAALLSGRVPYYLNPLASDAPPSRDSGVLNRIVVGREVVPILQTLRFARSSYPDFQFGKLMTKEDAGKALGLPSRFWKAALAQWPTDKKKQTVPVEELEQLSRKFISPREFKLRLGMHGTLGRGLVEERGWIRKSAAGFDRAEVERYLNDPTAPAYVLRGSKPRRQPSRSTSLKRVRRKVTPKSAARCKAQRFGTRRILPANAVRSN